MLESANEHFVRAVLNLKMKFLESMDDDFNTASAIGVLHELAGEINSFIERTGGESKEKPADVVQVIAAAGQTTRGLGNLLGLFRPASAAPQAKGGAGGAGAELASQLMELMIQLRQFVHAHWRPAECLTAASTQVIPCPFQAGRYAKCASR